LKKKDFNFNRTVPVLPNGAGTVWAGTVWAWGVRKSGES
jgi:hypothetical protein